MVFSDYDHQPSSRASSSSGAHILPDLGASWSPEQQRGAKIDEVAAVTGADVWEYDPTVSVE
jgi:hypothetical protein